MYQGDCTNLSEIYCGTVSNPPHSITVTAGQRYSIELVRTLFASGATGSLTTSFLGGSPCGPCTDCDGDTYDMSVDCDDGNASVFPGAMEIMGNGIDDNCDGLVDACSDCDGDGYFAPNDGDDMNPNVHPGAMDIWGNGIDDNCNGTVDEPTGIGAPPGRIRTTIGHRYP